MAYTALEKMREKNRERFGKDVGPMQPPICEGSETGMDLKSAALRFLRERCEGLRFSPEIETEEAESKQYRGTSIRPNQIPYNMEMDINRRCLEKTLESFLVTGTAENAYPVYYSFFEIFLGRYGESKRMVELLSEYEENGSSLLLKHRDHYSHSVNVFALGLALYETNARYRESFCRFYQLGEKTEAERAGFFLRFWGLTALFHDIGYPFELPFEQVLSYFEVDHQERGEGCPYLSYHGLESLTALSEEAQKHFEAVTGQRFTSIGDLLAWDIARKLGEPYSFPPEYLQDIVRDKPSEPERFGYYMDHAVFSALRLYRQLEKTLGAENLSQEHIDALTAILLHNSIFKFAIAFYKDKKLRKKPLPVSLHPLAWLLMLCDELQCWDRVAYGRNTRTEMHPMAAEFDFSDGKLSAVYFYDCEEQRKIDAYFAARQQWETAGRPKPEPRLKAYSDMVTEEENKDGKNKTENRFTADIEKIVNLGICPLHVVTSLREADRWMKHTYLSDSSFLHLYDFAVALHGRRLPEGTPTEEMERLFRSLSLEYQLSTISRARYFGRYLDAIGCFYTDRPVDYDMVTAFTPEQAAVFAPMEHERWLHEHRAMGWRFGCEYETLPLPADTEDEKHARQDLREQLRCHKMMMDGELTDERVRAHWLSLPEEEQDKDWKPFNKLLDLLREFDGLRIYRLNGEEEDVTGSGENGK